ncbi:MAG: DUF2723 domain-containing protein [Candidatus Aminicenantes bacterium]|nr:DUF2723 domain-containing protein [Candidatus Aminicenantes bacterium]
MVVFFPGLFYLLTLYPGTVLFACDSARFQFVGKVLGTAHTTGYPLFTILSHGFVKILPFGNLAWKVNLLTALFAILALLVLFRILLFLKSMRRYRF